MLVITGNPGVGKHTIAKIVAKNLSLDLLDINAVAIKNKAVKLKDGSGYVVDLLKLSSLLRKHVNKKKLVVGHLAPYVLKKSDACMVAVIRRSPYELKSVYKHRGYSTQKMGDNLSSEIIGVCIYDAIKRFGKSKVAEFDNTGIKPKLTADKIINMVKGKKDYSVGQIDWLDLIFSKDDMRKFFEYR
ncbi:MAG: adenylate kinase family protein [Nitrososphaerales archaeon]